MIFSTDEILETIDMVLYENLDIRTVTMGINLTSCIREDPDEMAQAVYGKIVSTASNLCAEAESVSAKYYLPIVNKRIAVTPIGLLLDLNPESGPTIARGHGQGREQA